METHPILHLSDNTVDKRYKITKEYCGYSTPMFIARFCDETICCNINYDKCVNIAQKYSNERNECL